MSTKPRHIGWLALSDKGLQFIRAEKPARKTSRPASRKASPSRGGDAR